LNKNADADIDKLLIKLRNLPAEIYTIEELKISLETPPTKTVVRKRRKQMDKDQNQEEGFAGGEGDIEGTIPGFTTESDIQLERVTYKDLIKVLEQIEEKDMKSKKSRTHLLKYINVSEAISFQTINYDTFMSIKF
jgi:hypothetical protein